jgi:hypothetical protein
MRVTEAQILAVNGGVEAIERHERVQQQLAALIARIERRIDEARRAWEAEQVEKAS